MNEKIQAVLDTEIAAGAVVGASVILLKNGEEILCQAAGYRDLENKIPITRDTILRIYSMSKPITSAAVMSLVAQGKLDISAPVSDYLPEYANSFVVDRNHRRPAMYAMQVADLMNMTSGLPYGEDPSPTGKQVGKIFADMDARLYSDNPMSTMEFAQRVAQVDLLFDPGTHFRYGISADILGAIVEKVSGMKFSEYLQKTFFDPLDMKDTGFWVPPEKQNRLAKVYKYALGGGFEENKTNNLGVRYCREEKAVFESGGAGLVSTIDDYAKFGVMLMNNGKYKEKEILPKYAAKWMHKGGLNAVEKEDLHKAWTWLDGYTYGNLMRCCDNPAETMFFAEEGEYGWDSWLGTFFSNEPSRGLTMVFGTQMTDIGQAGQLIRKLKNVIMCEY